MCLQRDRLFHVWACLVQLMLFVSWLAQSVSPSTMAVYLASARSLHIDVGFPDPTIQAIRLRAVIHSIQQTSMDAILMLLEISPLSFHLVMFWAACCLAVFGFLRVSEFTSASPFTLLPFLPSPRSPSGSTSNSPKLILLVTVVFTIWLRLINTFTLSVLSNITPAIRGSAPGPLFIWSDVSPWTAPHVNHYLQVLLPLVGLTESLSSHGFRIGAATEAAAGGFPNDLIRAWVGGLVTRIADTWERDTNNTLLHSLVVL